MKKFTAVLLALIVIITAFGCSKSDTITCYAEPDKPEVTEITDNAPPDAVLPSAVVAEAESFIITLPDIAAEHCDFTVSDDTVIFTMKDGGDYVCEFTECSAADYPDEFWIYKAAESGSRVVYMALPTCGTLNNESIRELLDKVTEALKTATVEFK